MDPIAYDATVRPDREAGMGYMAISTARYAGVIKITDWAWAGYGDTVEAAIQDLEAALQKIHVRPCQPRRIIYELEP